MNIENFIDNLSQQKVFLTVSEGNLTVEGPVSVLTEEVKNTLRQRKPEIIGFLTEQAGQNNQEQSGFPLSYTQLCFWFVYFIMNETANNLSRLLFRTPVRSEIVEAALRSIIIEHDIFQVTFGQLRPVQTIQSAMPFTLESRDLKSLDETEQHHLVAEDVKDMMVPFDLNRAPLFRFRYYQLNETESLLVSCFPHIILDGAAMHLFETEIREKVLASQLGSGRTAPTTANSLRNYVNKERLKYSVHVKEQEAFWREKLKGFSWANFPKEYLCDDNARHIDREIIIPDAFLQKMREASIQRRVSMQMIIATIISQAIFDATGQTQFVVNSVLENRVDEDEISLMAPVLYLLPTPIRMSAGISFDGVLEQVKLHITDAQSHMDIPFSVPQGMIAASRWRGVNRLLAWSAKLLSRSLSRLISSAKLYPSFWSDYLLIGSPPFSNKRLSTKKGAISDPVININVLPNIYKNQHVRPGINERNVESLTDKHRFIPQQALDGNWEDEQIDFYVSRNGKDQIVFRITCCCLNEQGVAVLEKQLNKHMDVFCLR